MDRSRFLQLADTCLDEVASWLEGFDPDEVDFTQSDGVLKIEFPDGVTFVLNRQTAAEQMWFAAGARAWHFDWTGEAWEDARDGTPLAQCIAAGLSEKLGRKLHLELGR